MPRRGSTPSTWPDFLDTVVKRYHGTRLGRQEIEGEIIEQRPDALWTRAQIERARVDAPPPLQRVVVAVDPPGSARKGADACGLVAAGRGDDGIFYVLADESAPGLSPQGWAMKAIALWRRLSADVLVAEVETAALAMAANSPREQPGTAAPGRAIVPMPKAAQHGSAGAVVAAGAAAAQQAHQSGHSPEVIAAIVLTAIAAAVGVWLLWHWRQRQQQEKPA